MYNTLPLLLEASELQNNLMEYLINEEIKFDDLEAAKKKNSVNPAILKFHKMIAKGIRSIYNILTNIIDKAIQTFGDARLFFINKSIKSKLDNIDTSYFENNKDEYMKFIKNSIKPDWYKEFKIEKCLPYVFEKMPNKDALNETISYDLAFNECFGYRTYKITRGTVDYHTNIATSIRNASSYHPSEYIQKLKDAYTKDLPKYIKEFNGMRHALRKIYVAHMRKLDDDTSPYILYTKSDEASKYFANRKRYYTKVIMNKYTICIAFIDSYRKLWNRQVRSTTEFIKLIEQGGN